MKTPRLLLLSILLFISACAQNENGASRPESLALPGAVRLALLPSSRPMHCRLIISNVSDFPVAVEEILGKPVVVVHVSQGGKSAVLQTPARWAQEWKGLVINPPTISIAAHAELSCDLDMQNEYAYVSSLVTPALKQGQSLFDPRIPVRLFATVSLVHESADGAPASNAISIILPVRLAEYR